MFKRGDTVEFTTTVTCRTIVRSNENEQTKSHRVKEGQAGRVCIGDWLALPGDLPVMITDEQTGEKLVVSAREGHIAKVKFEKSSGIVKKIYRNMQVIVGVEDDS